MKKKTIQSTTEKIIYRKIFDNNNTKTKENKKRRNEKI